MPVRLTKAAVKRLLQNHQPIGVTARKSTGVPMQRAEQASVMTDVMQTASQEALSENERTFDHWFSILAPSLPTPEPEHPPFPDRKFRIDRSWPALKLAVELEGYGHGLENRYLSDCEKYNRLSMEGWMLLRIPSKWIREDPQMVIDLVARAYACCKVTQREG